MCTLEERHRWVPKRCRLYDFKIIQNTCTPTKHEHKFFTVLLRLQRRIWDKKVPWGKACVVCETRPVNCFVTFSGRNTGKKVAEPKRCSGPLQALVNMHSEQKLKVTVSTPRMLCKRTQCEWGVKMSQGFKHTQCLSDQWKWGRHGHVQTERDQSYQNRDIHQFFILCFIINICIELFASASLIISMTAHLKCPYPLLTTFFLKHALSTYQHYRQSASKQDL